MTDAVGPVFTGGLEPIPAGEDGRAILFLPDLHNKQLQQEGKQPVYYYMPSAVRLARKTGSSGDYKFHLIHFVGVRGDGTTVGVSEKQEMAGGVLSLTTTSGFPIETLRAAQEKFIETVKGGDDRYWGWRSQVRPVFRPMPIVSCVTALSNLSPQADGTTPEGDPRFKYARAKRSDAPLWSSPDDRLAKIERYARSLAVSSERTVDVGGSARVSRNLDPWFWKLQGQGPGSVIPDGENAFSGLVGSVPAALLWQGFRTSYSPLVVTQALKMKVWSQNIRLSISGDWKSIYDHFSAHAQGRYLWFSADIKAELNRMRISGDLKVEIEVDGTVPGSDKIEAEINKRADLITAKFLEQAQKTIFDPPPPNVSPAEAKSNPLAAFELGVALKYRRDERETKLSYSETRHHQYLQNHFISSSLEGFYDEIKADPANEKKYFTRVFLDDWERNVRRVIFPVCNWPNPERKWIGEPVAKLAAQVGYPNSDGSIQWDTTTFQAGQPLDVNYVSDTSMKKMSEVASPPKDWAPDITFIKRTVHLREAPSELESPYVRMFVEKNTVELDPPNGTPTNTINIEVRAESAGKLEIGPLNLDVLLSGPEQIVEVEIQPMREDGANLRASTIFRWTASDQDEGRFLVVYTGDPTYRPRYKYRVTVTVKGTLFAAGMKWSGDWVERNGNGPTMITVPTAGQPRVVPVFLEEEARERMEGSESSSGASEVASVSAPTKGIGAPTTGRNSRAPKDDKQVAGYRLAKSSAPPVIESRTSNGKKTTLAETE